MINYKKETKSNYEIIFEKLLKYLVPGDSIMFWGSTFIIYEDWSIVWWEIIFWKCKWQSCVFWVCDNDKFTKIFDELCWLDGKNLYNDLTSSDAIFKMWINYANRTSQQRKFKHFKWVYILYNKWEVVYVWQSSNIFNRMSWHRNKEYDEIEFIPVYKSQDILWIEYSLIKKYNPKYNIMHNDWIRIKN